MKRFDVIAYACWRLSHMVTKDDGPYDVFKALRAIDHPANPTHCIMCASVWAAALLVLLEHTPLSFIVDILAVSGKALQDAAQSGAGVIYE
jgi:hypothetical protein